MLFTREYRKPETLWNTSYFVILFMAILMAVGLNMVTPILSRYLNSLGASLSMVGILASLMSVVSMFMRPISGFLADRMSKKALTIFATVTAGCSICLYAMTSSIPLITFLRITNGLGMAFHGTCAMSMASYCIPEKRMGEGLGYIGIGQIIATAVGPNLGLWLIDNVSYRAAFLIAGGLILTTAVISLLFISAPETPKYTWGSQRIHLTDFISVKMIPYSLFAGVFSMCISMNSSFIALVGETRGIPNVGIFFTANACALLFVRLGVGRFIDRLGFRNVLIPGYVLTGTAMILLAFATKTWMLVPAGILIAFSQGTAQPMVQAECVRQMADRRGLAMSTCYVGSDLCSAFGITAGGRVADMFGFTAMYGMCALIMFVALFLFILFERKQGMRKG